MTEHISALADNESALADVEQLMVTMQTNNHEAEVWARYHLIGDVMRGTAPLSQKFTQQIMSKIEQEPTVLSPNAALTRQTSTLQYTADAQHKMPVAWSIAASFTVVMLVGWMVLQTQLAHDVVPAEFAQVFTATKSTPLALSEQAVTQVIPAAYLMAHQASAPTASSYYIQSASYSE
ncbi:MAG: anti-sigma 24 factor [Methylotenera sp.]|nr:anti-sigma 24 factor [Methylotenera sp.]MSQ00029.1 anti-sigma 24 factor [Methylotenera sp.]